MAASGSDTELLTEHFGYPPVSLLDDIINSVNIIAEKGLDAVENGLMAKPPSELGFHPAPSSKSSRSKTPAAPSTPAISPEQAHKHEVENGTHQLETLLCSAIDVNFDKFELYTMRNILSVPAGDKAYIRLAHYDGLDYSNTAAAVGSEGTGEQGKEGGEVITSVESVTALRRRLQASQRLNVMLAAEKARNEALLKQLRGMVGQSAKGIKAEEIGATTSEAAPLAFLLEKGALRDADAERPLTTTTAFALSQMEALRNLSTELRRAVPALRKAGGGGDEDDVKGWRRERLEYIEGATRRHLEHTRGLELGKDGDVRDGEWQGEGRRLASGEVDGLERVVAVLGGGSAAGGSSATRNDEMDTS